MFAATVSVLNISQATTLWIKNSTLLYEVESFPGVLLTYFGTALAKLSRKNISAMNFRHCSACLRIANRYLLCCQQIIFVKEPSKPNLC